MQPLFSPGQDIVFDTEVAVNDYHGQAVNDFLGQTVNHSLR